MADHDKPENLVDWRLEDLERFRIEVKQEFKDIRSQFEQARKAVEQIEKSLHSYKTVMRFAMGVSSVLGAAAAFVADFFFKR